MQNEELIRNHINPVAVNIANTVFEQRPEVRQFSFRIPGQNYKYTIVKRGPPTPSIESIIQSFGPLSDPNIDVFNHILQAALEAYEPTQTPVPRERLTTLNTFRMTQANVDDLKNDSCSICLGNFLLDESVTKLDCNHPFHTGCIRKWFTTANTCPLCKAPV